MRLLSLLLLVLSVLCLANLSLAETEINPGVELRNQAVKADEEAIKSLEEARGSASKFEFQTEVNKLLGIIINSLYTNKDIFLRELISNASDALDKIRFLALTDSNALKSTPELEIRIRADKEHKELIIRDTGIGMTKEDLVNNLGTIARSGTKNFIEKVKEGSDLNMIGQFGVGFYSAFLVADRVTVITKNNDDDKQYIWESNADNTFSISEDPRGNTLGRGSEIRLFLKDDAQSYLDDAVLKDLIIKYSEFVHFPIQLYKESEVEKEVPVEEEEVVEEAKPEEEEQETKEEEETDTEKVDVEEEEKEEKEEKPKTKKVKELVGEFSVVNANKPIWTRPTKEVTTEEYNKFYKTISKEYDEPLTHIHFTAEGQDVVFKSILYVPGHAPSNLFETINQPKSTNIKLYVRKVFITDEFTDLMPRYLNFVRGVVDSDDLPLNVSREILQQSKLLRIIRKTLIRKSLEMLKNAAQAEEEAEAKEKEKEEKTENREDEETEETKPKVDYTKIWKEFGKNIRLGLLEDSANQSRLSKLLRYYTSKSGDKLVSFEKYVSNMKEGQKDIYFLSGDNLETVKNSPFLEALEKRGFEVVFMIDPIDEYVTNYLTEFDGKKLVNIAKEGLKFGDEEEKKNEAEFEDLTKYMKKVLGSKVESVKVSSRLTSTPCVLVSGQYGLTANMEKILKAQTMSVSDYGKATKVMEINPAHPIIKEINRRVRDNDDDLVAKDATELMYDTALMTGGFTVDDVPGFSNRIFAALKSSLNVEESAVEEDSTAAETTRTTTTDSDTESATTKPADEDDVRDEL